MPSESQSERNDKDIISLTSAYVKAVYTAKGDINHQTAIKIKNQIAVLLAGLYKDIVDGYLKDSLDKAKVTSFVQVVSHFIASGIIKAKEDMYGFLIEKNISFTHTDEQIEIVKTFINTQIDKNIASARVEMDNVVELFRQRCLEILLEGHKHSSSMLQMSHQRSMQRILKLNESNSGLQAQVSDLITENSGLKEQVTTLQTDIDKKQKVINDGYRNWKKLNSRVGDLEKEREGILSLLGQIETELAQKKRRLKGETLIDKINEILTFTREMQNSESTWQQTFVQQQNFDRLEVGLREEISALNQRLTTSQAILEEVNNELIEEQRKVQTLTSTDETAIKEIIKTQITDYFHFLFHTNDFVNITKQEELELAIKMTFYRAKVLNLDIINTINNLIERLKINYENSYHGEYTKVSQTYNNLKDFINGLEYSGRTFEKEARTYRNIYEMNA